MKDYEKIANRIRKMGTFCDIHQCGSPTVHCPVNLIFQTYEENTVGYVFYVSYDYGKWSIDYTLNPAVKIRTDMKHIRGITSDKDMYAKCEEIIGEIRKICKVA